MQQFDKRFFATFNISNQNTKLPLFLFTKLKKYDKTTSVKL